jgi:hypothetical protein
MHNSNEITYQTRSRILVATTVFCESIHFLWQVYGNVIYFQQSKDPKVMECKDKKNPGLNMMMLMLIIFGYFFFVIYLMVILLVGGLYFRRFSTQRAQ